MTWRDVLKHQIGLANPHHKGTKIISRLTHFLNEKVMIKKLDSTCLRFMGSSCILWDKNVYFFYFLHYQQSNRIYCCLQKTILTCSPTNKKKKNKSNLRHRVTHQSKKVPRFNRIDG